MIQTHEENQGFKNRYREEPEKELIIGFLVGPRSNRDVINNLIKILK